MTGVTAVRDEDHNSMSIVLLPLWERGMQSQALTLANPVLDLVRQLFDVFRLFDQRK